MGHYSNRMNDETLILGDDGVLKKFSDLTIADLRKLAVHQSGQIYELYEQLRFARSLLLAQAGIDGPNVDMLMRSL